MSFKQSRQQKQSERDGMRAIAQTFQSEVERCAEISRQLVAKETGDLESTIRVSEPEITERRIRVALMAGGKAQSGRMVDYADEQEIMQPYLWPAVIAWLK